jgi:HSP20 family protein
MNNNGNVAVRHGETVRGPVQSTAQVERAPSADIVETRDRYLLMLDMPGAERESIGVTIDRDVLNVTGTVRQEPPAGTVLFSELDTTAYGRTFTLGQGIDRNRVEAGFENGVLRITLHKTEEVKPREITIR